MRSSVSAKRGKFLSAHPCGVTVHSAARLSTGAMIRAWRSIYINQRRIVLWMIQTRGRCGQEFRTSAKWRYFCPNCRQTTLVKNGPRKTFSITGALGGKSGAA